MSAWATFLNKLFRIRSLKRVRAVNLQALQKAICGLACCCVLAFSGQTASAAQTLVIQSDRGGFLKDRLIELNELRDKGVRVEIRGNFCYSTCTMYLGLENICVDSKTTFGFHGPSRSGKKLKHREFEYFSRVIASYYPNPIKHWYMGEARHRVLGIHRVKGEDIIKFGVPACA